MVRRNLQFFLILLLPILIIFNWFREKVIFGGGEAGIPFYSLTLFIQIFGYAFSDKLLGYLNVLTLSNYPLFWFFSSLEKLGFPNFLNQAIFFLSIFLLSGLGVYLLVFQSFKSDKIAKLSVLFYWFNFAAMVSIWNRFQYPYMSFYGFLPIVLYLFKQGLVKKKIIYALVTNLVFLFAIITFISIPTLELYFGVLFCYLLFDLLLKKFQFQEILFSIFYFASFLIVLVLFNIWWLAPFLSTLFSTSYITQVAYTPSGNLDTLTALSDRLGNLSYVFRLMHRDYFLNMREVWGTIYQNPLFVIISFLVPIFVFGSFIVKKKPREYYFFFLLAILGVFLAKGVAPPFGGFFNFLFTHVRYLEAFRNPFEKISLLLPLSFAPLFGFGIYHFYLWLQEKSKRYTKASTILLLVLIYGVLIWPIWTGWVFTSTEPPTNNPKIGARVEVPSYYSLANDWLNKENDTSRIIALPMSGEGITYTWRYGYNGVELSNTIFNKPFISACTTIQFLCPITQAFQPLLFNHPNDFWKALPPLNAKYVMLREDIDWKLRGMQNPADVKKVLDRGITNIAFEKQFDKLYFYRLADREFTPKVFAQDQGIYSETNPNDSFVSGVWLSDYKKGDIYFTDPQKTTLELPYAKQIIVKAEEFLKPDLKVSRENALLELPYVRFLPDSVFYPLIRLKEKAELFLAGNNSFIKVFEYSNKRLVETFRLIEKGNYPLAKRTLDEYLIDLNYILQRKQEITQTKYKEDLLRQMYVMTDIIQKLEEKKMDALSYKDALGVLNKLLYETKVNSLFAADPGLFKSYSFSIPEAGVYKAVLDAGDFGKFFNTSEPEVVIDQKETIKTKINNQTTSPIFSYNFSKGDHQIDIKIPQGFNLVGRDSLVLSSKHGVGKYNLLLLPFSPFARYRISFDYYVEKGNLPSVYLAQDTDLVKKGKRIPKVSFALERDNYYNGWRHFEETFYADNTSHKADLVFEVRPFNDCKKKNPGFLAGRCRIKSFYESFDKETVVQVKNLKVERDDLGSLFLVRRKINIENANLPDISYQEENPAVYKVHIRNAKGPFFLAFLESYHPLWKAYILNNGKQEEIVQDKHLLINSFANAWYIDKTGSYDLLLEFYPERLFALGKKVSFVSLGVSAIILFIIFLSQRLKKKYGGL